MKKNKLPESEPDIHREQLSKKINSIHRANQEHSPLPTQKTWAMSAQWDFKIA